MKRPSATAHLRELTANATTLVQMLRDTGRAPGCFDLTGRKEAEAFVNLLDGLGQASEFSRAAAVAFLVRDGLDAHPDPELAVKAALFAVGNYLAARGSKPFDEIAPQLLATIRAGVAAGPMPDEGFEINERTH